MRWTVRSERIDLAAGATQEMSLPKPVAPEIMGERATGLHWGHRGDVCNRHLLRVSGERTPRVLGHDHFPTQAWRHPARAKPGARVRSYWQNS